MIKEFEKRILSSFILIPLVIFINDLLFADGYGIYINSEINLYLAMFLGALFFYLGSKLTIKKEDKP